MTQTVEIVEADYVVVGGGAMGMAFVDTLLDETDADVVIVDRYDKPGGHWRVAYDHVRLHQPSAFYGVNSRPMGTAAIDRRGYNAGLRELAGLDEIREYFDRVLREKFLPSGRVRYLANSEYRDGQVRRLLSGDTVEVKARRRVVDATFMKVAVPSVTPPPFAVAGEAQVVPPNSLARLSSAYDRYVVLGGGKTALDAILWMLESGSRAEQISWVIPRDAWFYNREICQPGPEFVEISDRYNAALSAAWMESTDLDELLDRLVESKYLLRLSDEVRPTAYRCATVTESELTAVRAITDVIRLGRAREVNGSTVVFEQGVRTFEGNVLFIDCTANGLAPVDPVPVFDHDRIRLQAIAMCQQVFSAAFIAHVESRFDDDATKNALTIPVPHPSDNSDYPRSAQLHFRNELAWSKDPELVQWKQDARLAGLGTRVGTPIPAPGPEREAHMLLVQQGMESLIEKADLLLSGVAKRGAVTVDV